MTTCFVNFDFEENLKKEKFIPFSYDLKHSTLEHVFFWMSKESETLFTERKYEAEYLKFIEECRNQQVKLTSKKKESAVPWWGSITTLEEWEREKVVNSNEMVQIVRDSLDINNLGSVIVNSYAELKEVLNDVGEPFVIKEELGFSGKGLHFKEKENLNFPVIVEKWVQRVRDFGVRLDEKGEYLIQNLIDRKGGYKGSLVKDKFEESGEIFGFAKKIFDLYKKKLSVSSIQIDSFQYLEEGILNYQPLCEVNHRRSMGEIAWGLHGDFGDSVSVVLMVNAKKLNSFENFGTYIDSLGSRLYNKGIRRGLIPLSPLESSFRLFFLTEESERTLQYLIKDWWSFEAKTGERLPSEFVVYF